MSWKMAPAKRTIVNGIEFASKSEAMRYQELRYMELAREITQLETQPKFSLDVNGQHICNYTADFRYLAKGDREVVEDVKSAWTAKQYSWKLVRKLMKAVHGIDVIETRMR